MSKFIETEAGEVLNFDHVLSLQKLEKQDRAWIEVVFAVGGGEVIVSSRNIEVIRESWFSLKEYLETHSVYLLKKEILERRVKERKDEQSKEL
jgi:hypothetical protein